MENATQTAANATPDPSLGIFIASITIIGLYILAATAREKEDLAKTATGKTPWAGNPLVITRGPFGRASLSNLQLFFYSLIVVWLLVFDLVRTGQLMEMSQSVLILLGISALGTASGKATDTVRNRLSPENWSWLVEKGWIKKTLDTAARPPVMFDLLQSNGKFDVTRFQALAFSIVVGITLVVDGIKSGLGDLKIGDNILFLIGLSQAVYVGGKAVVSSPIAEIDAQVTKLRELEQSFMAHVATEWKKAAPATRDLNAAKAVAPDKYEEYKTAAKIAIRLVADRTKDDRDDRNTDPSIPGA